MRTIPTRPPAGTRIERVVLKDRVTELLKEDIFSGRLKPGDRIVEMKVAADFGVATTSVREALFELESQGFVTRVTNKGTFVTELTKEDVAQMIRVRRELEGLAAELAEQQATEDDVVRLRSLVSDMENAARLGDLDTFYRSDLEFHRTIWATSGNRHLTKALDTTIVPLFAFFIMRNPSDTGELLESVTWHGRIVDAIRDHSNARKAMEDALEFFNQQENWMLFDGPKSA